MSDEQRTLALRNAVLEWQKKYGIRDGDPILATLELLQIYLSGFQPSTGTDGHRPPSFEEFRESIELLDQRSKEFVKHAGELMQAMRALSNVQRALGSYRASTLFLVTFVALTAGVLIGKFVL